MNKNLSLRQEGGIWGCYLADGKNLFNDPAFKCRSFTLHATAAGTPTIVFEVFAQGAIVEVEGARITITEAAKRLSMD